MDNPSNSIEVIQGILNGSQTNLVLADLNEDIYYINKKTIETLTPVAAELEASLPNFKLADIVGGSIHRYHQNPDHNKRMLKKMKQGEVIEAIINPGRLTFELLVQGIYNKDGSKIGYSMEWSDITVLRKEQEKLFRLESVVEGSNMAQMQVDLDLYVTGVNPKTVSLLEDNKEIFEQVYPAFDFKKIMGANIDVFHAAPQYQRKILRDPKNLPHKADIQVGPLKFELNIAAMRDTDGEYIGSSLEWSDVTALRNSEAEQKGILGASLDPMVTIDGYGIVQSVSDSIKRVFGWEVEEVIEKNIKMLMPEPYFSEHDGVLERYRNTGIANILGLTREFVGIRKNKETFPCEISISKVDMGAGTKPLFTGIIRDITDRKQTEDELRKNNQEIRKQIWMTTGMKELNDVTRGLMDIKKMGSAICSYLAKYLNVQIMTFFVAKEEELELVGSYAFSKRKNFSDRIAFGEGIVGQAAIENTLISITDVPEDYTRINSSLVNATPRHVVCVPFSVENTVMGVIEIGSFEVLSDEQLELLGALKEPIGLMVRSIHDQAKTRELLKETQRQSNELKSFNEELQQQTTRLKTSEEELKVQGEELKVNNEELVEKQKVLQKQTSILETAKNELEQRSKDLVLASKYKSEFLANMSHELRTPLNSLLILSKGLSENKTGNLTSSQVEDAEIIYDGGNDLLILINDIMDLSKVEAGMLNVQMEDVKLSDVTRSIQTHFSAVAKDKGLELNIALKGAPNVIRTDGQRLTQILRNFMSNAFKFTEMGSVTIKVDVPEPGIKFSHRDLKLDQTIGLSVIDTGIGVPENKQKEIFESFQQADGSTSRKYGGTGLGLTISRELAKLLGGEIQLSSTEGEGSTFTLYLPLKLTTVVSSGSMTPAPASKERSPQTTVTANGDSGLDPAVHPEIFIRDDRQSVQPGDKSILIIEDDEKFANILANIIRKNGYKVLAAGKGRNGIYMALDYLPSGILLDMGLPDMKGLDVLDQLKYNLKTRHIPVHVISGSEDRLNTLKKGALGFLAKPTSAENIAKVISDIGDLVLDDMRMVLIVEDDDRNRIDIMKMIEHKSLKIDSVGTGKEACEKISANEYDCVILDLGLADISGFEVMKTVSENSEIKMPPIIVYTGQELSTEQENELKKYASSIVVKGAESPERLLDEISLFLHSIQLNLPEHQREAIGMLHDVNQQLIGKRVLLVDDDMRNAYALSKKLIEYGLEVVKAVDGKKAITTLEEDKSFDLILMDIMMPVMNGYEAMQAIRKMKSYMNIPMIALTAKAMPEDRAKCIDSGANDYLTKPLDVSKLISMIRVWLFSC